MGERLFPKHDIPLQNIALLIYAGRIDLLRYNPNVKQDYRFGESIYFPIRPGSKGKFMGNYVNLKKSVLNSGTA